LQESEGWLTPIGPSSCPHCAGKQIGVPFKVAGPDEQKARAQVPAPTPTYKRCTATRGCMCIVREGEAHTAPCLTEGGRSIKRAPKEMPE